MPYFDFNVAEGGEGGSGVFHTHTIAVSLSETKGVDRTFRVG